MNKFNLPSPNQEPWASRERARKRGLIRAIVICAILGFGAVALLFLCGCTVTPAVTREQLTPAEYGKALGDWVDKDTSHLFMIMTATGSMLPLIGETDTPLAFKPTGKTVYRPGMIVRFDRGDCPRVLHMIDAVSSDNQFVHLTGINNLYSDGWFNRSKIDAVVVRVISARDPELYHRSMSLAQLAARKGEK